MKPPGDRTRRAGGAVAIAGAVGGGLCGVADALLASFATIGAAGKGPKLALFGLGVGVLVGLVAALMFLLVRAAVVWIAGARVERTKGSETPSRPFFATIVASVVLAAPVVIYDGFALFAGAQARKLPGHAVLPYVALSVGLVAVAIAAWVVSRLLLSLSVQPSRRLFRYSLALAGVALVAAVFTANRVVLPRLYPWFHATLALLVVVLAIITARILLGAPAGPSAASVVPLRFRPATLAAIAIVASVLAAHGWRDIAHSQMQRFVIFQKTQLLSPLLQSVPVRPSAAAAVSKGRARPDRTTLPPLPDGPRRADADIVLITIDALRPDHMGAYGYRRNTTPNLDALARRAVRFERAYTQAPNTSFASTTILTGKYYPTLARLGPPDGLDTLPLLLRRYGFKTAAFYPPAVFYIGPDKLKAYADSNFHFEYVKIEFLPAAERLEQIRAFFAEEKPERAFLWLHLFEPHETYERHPGFDFGATDIDRYDSEIAYVDQALGEILAYLARARPRAVVIVTADHGEEFDEHKARYHGTTLYEEQTRVPLLIAVPGLAPQVIRGPVELVDLAPTILGLLDIPIPLRMRGHDLGPWLRDPPASLDRLSPAFAEVNDLRMVATADEKLICDDKQGFCQLFDLRVDPREQRNLAEARPDRVTALRAEIDGWLADNAALERAKGEGGKPQDQFPPVIERARLGDITVASDVAALLSSATPLVQREAARLIATTMPPLSETRPALLKARASSDREVAGWANIALARLGDSSARQELATSLSKAAPSSIPDQQQIFSALAVADAGSNTGVPTLVRAVSKCEDPVFCIQLINALGSLRDPRATDVLIARLPTVVGRREVVAALGKISDPRAVPALSDRLRNDEYTPVRIEAAGALATMRGNAARVNLTRALRTEREPTVRVAIAKALETFGRPRQDGLQ